MKERKQLANKKEKDIQWTSNDVNIWATFNLIPSQLLNKNNELELMRFIVKNHEKLFSYHTPTEQENNYTVSLPPPDQFDSTYELKVVDSKTGKVVSVLEQVVDFYLFKNVSFRVKRIELERWQKDTEAVKNINSEQATIVKKTLIKAASQNDNKLSRKDVVRIIEEVCKNKNPKKIRHGGHLVDAKLCSNKKIKNQEIVNNEEEVREESNFELKPVCLNLSPQDDKLINALYNILHNNSENRNIQSPGYYNGNMSSEIVSYGNKNEKLTAQSIKLRFKPHELYKAYTGKENYSGKEIKNINGILDNFEEKKYYIQYSRQKKVLTGKETKVLYDRIEAKQPMITVARIGEGLTQKEINLFDKNSKESNNLQNQKFDFLISFNPIFTDQIGQKYVEYPEDINNRTQEAAGGARKVTISIIALRDYCFRELSVKRYSFTIKENTLINLLVLNKYSQKGRKQLTQKRINDSINSCKKMKLIEKVEIEETKNNERKYTFSLNKNFK